MSQYNWILLDDFGNRYKVGIYHGEQSGHVLIHCNKKILIIDFNVLGNKTYSFFLGYEFCELKVTRGAGTYHYDLTINEKVDTVLNQKRKKIRRKDNFKSILLAILFFALVIILTYFLHPVETDI